MKPPSPRSNSPFDPSRFPFFYGWVILVVGTLAVVMSVPGQTIGVSAFTDALIEALGISRLNLSLAYMVGTIAGAFLLPLGGRFYDRFGARPSMALASAGLGLTLVYMSQVDRVARLLAGGRAALMAATAMITIVTGFLALRFFGQGMMAMVGRAMLGKWFNRRRGLVAGISAALVGFCFSVAPRGMDFLLQWRDWRWAWLVMAAGMGGGMLVLSLIFFRDNPEQCGLVMDGRELTPEEQANDAHVIRHEYTGPEARRDGTFWIFNLALAAPSLILTGMTFHIVAIGGEQGLARELALSIFLPMSIVSIASTFGAGWLCDRVALKYVLIVMLASLGIGSLGLLALGTPFGAACMIGGFGVSGGAFASLLTVVWPRYYGRLHLGAVSSMNMTTLMIASALGPILFSLAQRTFGAFDMASLACALLSAVLIVFALRARHPQHPERIMELLGHEGRAGVDARHLSGEGAS